MTEGKCLVTFDRNVHRDKFDVCFALVGTSASDSSAFLFTYPTKRLLKISPEFKSKLVF